MHLRHDDGYRALPLRPTETRGIELSLSIVNALSNSFVGMILLGFESKA